jgi:hypothetical protein
LATSSRPIWGGRGVAVTAAQSAERPRPRRGGLRGRLDQQADCGLFSGRCRPESIQWPKRRSRSSCSQSGSECRRSLLLPRSLTACLEQRVP